MNQKLSEVSTWGSHLPPREAEYLLRLVRFGFARGGVSKWIRRQWHKSFPDVVDAEIRGLKFRLNISDNTTDEKLLLSSKYYDGIEIEALSASGGRTFVDIGANTGYYSLMLAKRGFEKIIAIEPNPPTLQRLKFNIASNKFAETIWPVGLCVGQEGVVDFYCDGSLGSASLFQDKDNVEPISVQSRPLKDILEENSLDNVDAMKIDVEGFEDRVLLPFFEQAPKNLWPRILVLEHCHNDLWERDLLEYLLDSGDYALLKTTRANSIFQRID